MKPRCHAHSFFGSNWSSLLCLTCCILFIRIPALGEENIDSVQESARKWIELRMETAQLESDWAWQRDLLESTRDALIFKVEQLKEQEALLAAQSASDREKLEQARAKIVESTRQLENQVADNQETVDTLLSLRSRMPPRLSDSLDLAFKSVAEPNIPTGEKLQLIATILNRSFQFNNTITYSEEIVRIPGRDKDKLLTVLYWGLGQAYALDPVAKESFVGRPYSSGWIWISVDEFQPEITTLIDIFNEKDDPVLVTVPLHIDPLDSE